MLLIGTIIGAGFASGREILSFFGSDISIFVAPLCGLFIFFLSVMFLVIGKTIQTDSISVVNNKILGKLHVGADIFLLFNSLVVLSGMLAGMDSLFSMVLPIAPAYSIISGIICAFVVAKGLKGLLNSNLLIVPFIIIAIILICCIAIDSPKFLYPFRYFTLPAIIIYVSMNMMLACTVFTTIKELSYRQIFLSSAIAATIIAILMVLIILALNSTGQQGAMPIMQIALNKNRPLFYISLVAVAISIFTTMMTAMSGLTTWLKSLIGDMKYSVMIVLLAGLILSNLGFENVVGFLYPVIGIVGTVYIVFCAIYLFGQFRQKKALRLQKN